MVFDPDNKIVRFMLLIIILYCILSYVLNNLVQKDYNYDEMKREILSSKSETELKESVAKVDGISKTRFYLLIVSFGVLFVSYIYYKTQTAKSESIAIIFAVCLSLSGKLIEKIGLANCLTIPILDPKGSPGNVLLFDMFYTNFFAYFLDFIYAFAAVIVLTDGSKITSLFKKNKFKDLLKSNFSFFTDGAFKYKNVIRFVLYLTVIVVFWNWGSIIRPKVTILLHRYLGIPVVDKNTLKLTDNKKDLKEGLKPELVTTIPSIGIIAATIVEGLIFTGVLFPMRQFFLYSLGNDSEYNSNKIMIFVKFIILTILVPVFIILITKYTLTSNDPNVNRYPKMISMVLGQYIFIPFVVLLMHSLFKLPVMGFIQKNKQIITIFYIVVPIVISIIMTLVGKNSVDYIEDTPEKEKIIEGYMSESSVGECSESNNKYIYVVIFVTLCMMVFSQGPFLSINKYQILNGVAYLTITAIIIKVIYEFQNNYEPYNILNPMRHMDGDHDEVDLDTTISIEVTMVTIVAAVCSLILFKKYL